MGMKYKLGIVGKDIAYSLSPYIHSSFGKEADIQLTYDIFDLDAGPLEFIEKFFEEGGTGLNITKPFKEIVAERYSPLGDVSINTLSLETKADLNNNTVIKGTSTDGAGLLEDLISRGINVKNKNVLLLGLGGAGYAIANFLSHISCIACTFSSSVLMPLISWTMPCLCHGFHTSCISLVSPAGSAPSSAGMLVPLSSDAMPTLGPPGGSYDLSCPRAHYLNWNWNWG